MHRFFIQRNGSNMILTSASLVRDSGDENQIDENLRVGVLCFVSDVLLRCCLSLITVLFAD